MELKKWNYNYKREYECKLCHKMNPNSYVCIDCRRMLQGLPKAKKRGVVLPRKPNKCIDCNCSIVGRGLSAKRCRDCTVVNNRLRDTIRRQIQFVDYKINQIETAKNESIGQERRLRNLRLSREHLLARLNRTYLYDKKVVAYK